MSALIVSGGILSGPKGFTLFMRWMAVYAELLNFKKYERTNVGLKFFPDVINYPGDVSAHTQ